MILVYFLSIIPSLSSVCVLVVGGGWGGGGGGGVGKADIYKRGSRSMMLRDPLLSLSANSAPSRTFPLFARISIILITFFRDTFRRSSLVQMGSCLVSLESLRYLLSNGTNFMQFGVLSSKRQLREVRVFELFFSVFPTKIPAKPEMLSVNRDTLVVDEFKLFLKFFEFQINL
jgi:hypothetical protein